MSKEERVLFSCEICGDGELKLPHNKTTKCDRCYRKEVDKKTKADILAAMDREVSGVIASTSNPSHHALVNVRSREERKAERKARNCLKCRIKFVSESFGRRCCATCGDVNSRASAMSSFM